MNPVPRNCCSNKQYNNKSCASTRTSFTCQPVSCPDETASYQSMSKHQLMKLINEVSFAIDDIVLFLDTHPEDQKALDYFTHLSDKRKMLISIYSSKYAPLTLDSYDSKDTACWDWIMKPWPWEIHTEGGCK